MRFLLPIILLILGVGAGFGAGHFLAAPDEMEVAATDKAEKAYLDDEVEAEDDVFKYDSNVRRDASPDTEYVDFTQQFVVPVINSERMEALIIASISLEIVAGEAELFYSQEPRLRDSFLQVMFNHANIGGFEGAFTNSPRLRVLRRSLTEAADQIVGDAVVAVLFTELARQDQ